MIQSTVGLVTMRPALCLHIDQSEARAVLAVTNHKRGSGQVRGYEVLSTCPRSWRPLAWLPRTLLRSPATEHSVGCHLHISFLRITRKGLHNMSQIKRQRPMTITRWELELSTSLREVSTTSCCWECLLALSQLRLKNLLRTACLNTDRCEIGSLFSQGTVKFTKVRWQL